MKNKLNITIWALVIFALVVMFSNGCQTTKKHAIKKIAYWESVYPDLLKSSDSISVDSSGPLIVTKIETKFSEDTAEIQRLLDVIEDLKFRHDTSAQARLQLDSAIAKLKNECKSTNTIIYKDRPIVEKHFHTETQPCPEVKGNKTSIWDAIKEDWPIIVTLIIVIGLILLLKK